ncbi:PIG-L deacetylase family protein [Aeromicrobium endophyticum]|nr:PIG-L family deacetylase [Aeromicrobium endophyticum]
MSNLWRGHLEGMPHDPPHDPGGQVVVLSAHPDDEVLAVGGWLAGQTDRDVVFVTATDGEASHPGSPSITPDELRARRPGELVEALRRLGFVAPDVRRLGLPDGGLERHRDDLRGLVEPLLREASLVLAPFAHDGHPDHEALGRAVLDAVPASAVVWQMPIWTWAWTEPDEQPWRPSLRRLECTSPGRHRKRRAMAAFETQVKPLSDHPADLAVVDEALARHAAYAPEAVIV